MWRKAPADVTGEGSDNWFLKIKSQGTPMYSIDDARTIQKQKALEAVFYHLFEEVFRISHF